VEKLAESERIARAVSDELRATSYLLHPPLLDEMGCKPACAGISKVSKKKAKSMSA
jgi:hypothetical protein